MVGVTVCTLSSERVRIPNRPLERVSPFCFMLLFSPSRITSLRVHLPKKKYCSFSPKFVHPPFSFPFLNLLSPPPFSIRPERPKGVGNLTCFFSLPPQFFLISFSCRLKLALHGREKSPQSLFLWRPDFPDPSFFPPSPFFSSFPAVISSL